MNRGRLPLLVLALGAALPGSACSDLTYTIDGFPIDLRTGAAVLESGGLQANFCDDQGQGCDEASPPRVLAIDTGSPLTFLRRQADEPTQMVNRSFDIQDGLPVAAGTYPVRATFQDVEALPLTLDPAGPDAVLGGTLLTNFSIQIDFGKPTVTFWNRQGASDAFFGGGSCAVAVAGAAPTCYSVLHFDLLGSAELSATSEPDFLGLTGPIEVPATRIVLRGCAAPSAADPVNDPQPSCCTRTQAVTLATGTNVALLVATGVGPLILAQSAWDRIAANPTLAAPLTTPTPGPDVAIPSQSTPITGVLWSTLPRLALVDLESDPTMDQGACVDLGRARRLDWVENHRVQAAPACVQPCDTDLQAAGKAQNAAGYLELGGDLPVAIVPDGVPLLQSLRAELRQQGPQIDGLIGSNLLAQTTLEVDYKNSPTRAIFTCAPGTPRPACWSSPRCQRQDSSGDQHACFGLGLQSLPDSNTCLPSGCS